MNKLIEQIAEGLCLLEHGNKRWAEDYYLHVRAILPIIEEYLKPSASLEECLLSEDQIDIAWIGTKFHSDIEKDIRIHARIVCNEQLHSPKLAAYINQQKEDAKKEERNLIMERYYEGFMTLHNNVARPRELEQEE